jgi:cell division protein FtsB
VSRTALLTTTVLAGAALFGLFGGEFGTFDWLELRRQEREEREAIERLTAEVDSLRRFARRLETDRRLVEQIARENFGMIRQGEFLYRIETDSLDEE